MMGKKRFFIIFLLLVSLILIGAECKKEQEQAFEPEEQEDEQEELIETEIEELSMEIENGENFTISLEANVTTGYYWVLNLDDTYIQFINLEYIAGDSELVGSSGAQVFEFKALDLGETKITFSYERSWEDEPPLKQKIYTIIIK